MNKNLLLLAGVGAAYWFIRSQQSTPSTVVYNPSQTGGATAYLPAATTTATAPAAQPTSWINSAAGTVATGASIVKTGISLWDTIKDAFPTHTTVGDVTADGSMTNIWAGTKYEIS